MNLNKYYVERALRARLVTEFDCESVDVNGNMSANRINVKLTLRKDQVLGVLFLNSLMKIAFELSLATEYYIYYIIINSTFTDEAKAIAKKLPESIEIKE